MPKPAASPLIPASGSLVQDQTWGGQILVEGDVIVPAGITLTIAAGTVVRFSQAPVFRADERRKDRPIHDPNKCSLLVSGRLIAEGAPHAPVSLGAGTQWGGIHFLGKGEGRLMEAAIEGSVSEGVALWDEGSVDILHSRLEGCWAGAGAYGLSRLRLERCRLAGMKESGVIGDGSTIVMESCESRGHGLADVQLRGGSRLEAMSCLFSDGRLGIIAESGSCRLFACEFSGHARCVLDLQKGEHHLEGVKISGPGSGIYIGASRVTAENVELACAGAGMTVSQKADLSWKGGGWKGGKAGCLILGGRARLESLDCGGADQGIRLESGVLSGLGLVLKGHRAAALTALEKGSAAISDSRFEDCPTGIVTKGARVELADCWLSGPMAIGIELKGSGHRLERVSVRGVKAGLIMGAGRARARALEIVSTGTGVTLRRDAEFDWEGGSIDAEGTGIHLLGGTLTLRGVGCAGALQGIRLESGSLKGSGLALKGRRQAALSSLEEGSAAVAESRFEDSLAGVVSQGSRIDLRDCSFSGIKDIGIELKGLGHRLERVSIHGAKAGLVMSSGQARALALEVECSDTGVELRRGAVLEWNGGSTKGGRIGILIAGGALNLQAVKCAGARQGIRLESGGLAASGLVLKGQEEAALTLLEEGSAVIADSRFEDGPTGAVTRGARLELSGCTLSGLREMGIEVKGRGHSLKSVRIEDPKNGLWVGEGSSIDCEGFELACLGRAVTVLEGGRLDWKEGGWRGGAVGLSIFGGEADLEGLECRDARQGIRLEKGRVTGRRVRLYRHRDVGLTVYGAGRAEFSGGLFEDIPNGIVAKGGTVDISDTRFIGCSSVCCGFEAGSHGVKDCFFDPACRDIQIGPNAEVRREGGSKPPGKLRPVLWRLALQTRDIAVLRGIYRAIYAAAVRWVQVWSFLDRRVKTALVHRGWVTGDWEPGVSDLDFALIAGPLDGAWLEKFWRSYSGWRNFFPFLGEVLIATGPDMDLYLRHGGIRAVEMGPHSRALKGPRIVSKAQEAYALKPLEECAHAYTRLMQWGFFAPAQAPAEFSGLQLRKAAVDVLRYAEAGAAPAVSRKDFLKKTACEPGSAPALCSDVLRRFHDAARAFAPAQPPASSYRWAAPEAREDDQPWRMETVAKLRACFGEAMTGVFLDDLYRSYIVLEDEAVESPALAGVLKKWAALRRAEPWTGTLPIILSRSLWDVWRRLPYLESPTRFLEFSGAAVSAGGWFPDCRQFRWGQAGFSAAPPDAVVAGRALECAANLRVSWRILGSPSAGLSTSYLLHYLFTRTLGLRLLLERRVGFSFFDLGGILDSYRENFPDDAELLDQVRPREWQHAPQQAFFEHYEFLNERIGGLGAP